MACQNYPKCLNVEKWWKCNASDKSNTPTKLMINLQYFPDHPISCWSFLHLYSPNFQNLSSEMRSIWGLQKCPNFWNKIDTKLRNGSNKNVKSFVRHSTVGWICKTVKKGLTCKWLKWSLCLSVYYCQDNLSKWSSIYAKIVISKWLYIRPTKTYSKHIFLYQLINDHPVD